MAEIAAAAVVVPRMTAFGSSPGAGLPAPTGRTVDEAATSARTKAAARAVELSRQRDLAMTDHSADHPCLHTLLHPSGELLLTPTKKLNRLCFLQMTEVPVKFQQLLSK